MKNLVCPKCGRPVFKPMLADDSYYPADTMMCKDFGHWVGSIKECLTEEQFREQNQGVVISSTGSKVAWW